MISRLDEQTLVEEFKKNPAESFEEFLLDEELLSKQDLLKALQKYYDVPSIDLAGFFFDHDLVHLFPKEVMLNNQFIPYIVDGDLLIVIAADPSNEDLDEIIGRSVSYEVGYMVSIPHDITNAIKEFYDESLTAYGLLDDQDDEQIDLEQDEFEAWVEEEENEE